MLICSPQFPQRSNKTHMSIAARLTASLEDTKDADSRIIQFCHSITPDQILTDPLFEGDSDGSNSLASLSIYQLNQKQKELEEGLLLLNELWLVKALFTEIEVSFDPFVSGHYVCDLDELYAIVTSLHKAENRIVALAETNAAVVTSLENQLAEFRLTFITKLDALFDLFFPSANTVSESIHVNEDIEVTLRDYMTFCDEYGNRFMDSYFLSKFRNRRKTWETEFLQPLMNNKVLLELDTEEGRNTLRTIIATANPDLLLLLKSFQNFLTFINVMDSKPLKQYYSTAISNALVEAISRNIEEFMGAKESLTAELVRTIDLFHKTGWPMPLRNVFVSTNNIQESLHNLYLNWLGDKYINEIRTVFKEPTFLSLIANVEAVEEIVEIPAQQLQPIISPEAENNQKLVAAADFQSAEEASDDWNDAWGSEDDEDMESTDEKKGGAAEEEEDDDWNENWNDDWEDDEPEQTVESKPTRAAINSPAVPEPKTVAREAIAPAAATASFPTESQTLEATVVTETRVYLRSAMSPKLASILARYNEESNGSDPRLLCDAILSFSLLSYPALSDLLILLNDVDALENEYLQKKVKDQWIHYKQALFKELLRIVAEMMTFNENELEVDIHTRSEKVSSIIDNIFKKNLQKSNLHECKTLLLQLCNMINTVAVEQVLANPEISEQDSENYTQFLQALQFIEGEAMGKIGENVTKLVSWPKVEQLIILLNHHLTDIMKYFYDSKLYACSTEDLIKMIESVFIASDLRAQCIQEILEIRNIQ